jgi:hypothetical protein
MKKLAIIALLASAATMATAAPEIELHEGRNFGVHQDFFGVTLGDREGIHALAIGFDHASKWDRWSLVGSRDIAKIGPTTVAFKLGVDFIDPKHDKFPKKVDDGFAATAGLGLAVPLAPHLNLVADAAYQAGQHRVKDFNGAVLSAGLRYSF